MSDKNNESKSSQIGYSLVSFVCWCIVYAKTNRETFDALGSGTFYDLASLSLWGNVSVLGIALVSSIIAAAGIVTDNDCCVSIGKILGGITTLAFVGVVITQFVFICMIFHNDTEHFFIVNKAFWRSRAFNYSALGQAIPSSHPSVHQHIVPKPSEVWPYDMADILVRVPWGLIMAVLWMLAGAWVLFAVSAFVSYACKMCCGSETNTNRHMTESHQTRTSGRYVARETGGRQAIQTHVDSMRNGNARIVTPATNSIV